MEVQQFDNYTLLTPQSVNDIQTAVSSSSGDTVINVSGLSKLLAYEIQALQQSLETCCTDDKAVILVVGTKEVVNDDDESPVQIVPSISEATDMLFMIQMEREL